MRGQTGSSRTAQVVLSVLLCLTLTTAAIRVVASESARTADIVISGIRSVRVTGADGTVRDVTDGQRLRRGDTVATGPDGAATLTVESRRVVLASATSVVVPDGASLDLREGSVLVDRRRGPGLRLTAGDVVVDDVARGGLRVDRDFSVRVSVYSGRARVRTTTGRRSAVTALRSIGVSGRALPPAHALALTGSPWEADVIPDVVDTDRILNRLARGIDAERLLPEAIGRAAGGKVGLARALRAEGGSWGVVSALVNARAGDVAARLDALRAPLVGPAPGPGGSGTNGGGPGTAAGPGPRPTSGRPGPGPGPGPGPTPTGTDQPTSPPTPVDPVADLIETVEELFPTPTPTASAPPLISIDLP